MELPKVDVMYCPHCKNVTPVYSVFCCMCGELIRQPKRMRSMELAVPKPVQMSSGKWRAQLMQDGKRISITADTEQDYYVKARAIKAGLIKAEKTAPKMTVGQALDEYIASKDKLLSPSTLRGYRQIRANRFQAYMGRDIRSTINWQKAVNDESGDVKPKTVKNAWRLLESALKAQGVELPTVMMPRQVKAERPWLDYEQIQTFLGAVKGKPCELAALLALHGLRRSEILALKAEQVDVKKQTIRVEGAAVLDETNSLVQKAENKTDASRRTVHIVIPRLEELIKGKKGLLVTEHHNTLYRQINKVCEGAGLPLVGVHGLRHSFASLAYHLGWSEAATMREGGWSNSKTVHEIYTHLAAQDLDAAVLKMREFYKPEAQGEADSTPGITLEGEKQA